MQDFTQLVRAAQNDDDLQAVIEQIQPINYELFRVLGDVFWYIDLDTIDKKKRFMSRAIEYYLGEQLGIGEHELSIYTTGVKIDHVVLDSIVKAADANEMGKKLRVKLAGKEGESHCFFVIDDLGNTFFIDEETLSIF